MITDESLGHAAHCRRVAAYCEEIASSLKLPARDRAMLRQLALQHHRGATRLGPEAVRRLASDLGIQLCEPEPGSPAADRVAAPFSGDLLAQIVDAADDLDHEIEFNAYSDTTLSESLHSALEDVFEHPAIAAFLPGIRCATWPELKARVDRLPPFPLIALQLIRAAQRRNLTPELMVQIASSDQILAGALLAAANAAAYSWSGTVRNVQAAVMYLGEERAAEVLVACAMKPVLSGRQFRGLWEHSVTAACLAGQIASRCGLASSADAYVVGLLHDVGSLLLSVAPPAVVATRERLIRNGCAPAIAEVLTGGVTHAEAGAEVLRHWGLPADQATAVQFHHEPEHTDCPMASVLYLVEHCADLEEDLPSSARLRHALEVTGIKAEELAVLKDTPPVM